MKVEETEKEKRYFKSAPSITSKESMKEYYRKMLSDIEEQQGQEHQQEK